MAMPASTASVDVAIVGGGLAGLTLALQLRERCPQLSIRVLERRAGAAPVSAHKVGESTVEIGANYLANVLGLRDHLDAAQVRKFGFRFYFSEGCNELDHACELGISQVFPTPSWQVERGSFENFLARCVRDHGIEITERCRVRTLEPGRGETAHCIGWDRDGKRETLHARWLVDASGRAGLLRRKLDLAEDNGHHIGAAWFRIDARLHIDDWCRDPAWRARCKPPERWRSTNHLCGPGYWVWLIPLASGAHSVGIVADAATHPVESFNTFEHALAWLGIHQPALAHRLETHREALLDFRFLRNVSQGCRQVFSADRWALTGEAGLFLDPFYSPGTDFIAIANTYITGLVAHDAAGGALKSVTRRYQQLFFSFYRNMLALYRGQYALFGNARVMTAKVLWDYAYYWGVLAPTVIGGRQADLGLFAALEADLQTAETLNASMQRLFRDWHARGRDSTMPRWLDQQELAWFKRLNARLHDPLDDPGARARLREHVDLLRTLAGTLALDACRDVPDLDVAGLPPIPPDREPLARFDPYRNASPSPAHATGS